MGRLGPRGFALLAGVLVLLVARAWGPATGWGFTDGDTWADVAWARHPLSEQLLTPLTGGVGGANANFWRPLAMVQFWVQRRLFGWDAAGWHVWDLGLHVVAALLLAGFVATTTRRPGLAALAAVLFAVHPLADEVVPAVARNLDLLLGAGVFGALWGLAARSWVGWLGGLVVALGAKEAGVLLPLWGAAWVLLFRVDLGWRARGAAALRWGGAGMVVVVAYLLVRAQVVSGLGGYYDPDHLDADARLLYALRRGFVEPVLPGLSPHLGAWATPTAQTVTASVWAVLLGWLAWGRGRRVVLWSALVWVSYVALLGVTGTYTRRVLYVPTAAFVLVLLVALGEVVRRRSRVGGVVALAWGLTAIHASPLVWPYRDWAVAAATAAPYLDPAVWARVPDGATVYLVDRPYRVDLDPRKWRLWSRERSLTHAAVNYSVQAWLDERRPGLKVITASGWILDRPLAEQEVRVESVPGGLHLRRTGGTRKALETGEGVVTDEGDLLRIHAPAGSWLVVWAGDHVEVSAAPG